MRNVRAIFIVASIFAACSESSLPLPTEPPPAPPPPPPGMPKQLLQGVWYYQATIVRTDPNAAQFEGGASRLTKISWEQSQDRLVGSVHYESAPCGDGRAPAPHERSGEPIVEFEVIGNADSEDVEIDWTQNRLNRPLKLWVARAGETDAADLTGTALPMPANQEDAETDTNRAFFTDRYFDVTTRYRIEPDAYDCRAMTLYHALPRCAAGEADVRLSFWRIDPANDYAPLAYPDEVELEDDQGRPIIRSSEGRAPGHGDPSSQFEARSYPYNTKFGNFRLERSVCDRDSSSFEVENLERAGRFDIWAKSYADDGSTIPYRNRTAQPVVFYGSVGLPSELLGSAAQIAESWSKPMSETVAFLTGAGAEDLIQFRENACSTANITEYANARGLNDVVSRVAGGTVDPEDLEKVCAAIQHAELQAGATLDPDVAAKDGVPLAFTWQRKGDLRFNLLNYVHAPEAVGPWATVQFGQDPDTGEFVRNAIHYFGATGDLVAEREADVICLANGTCTDAEVFGSALAAEPDAASVPAIEGVDDLLRQDVDAFIELALSVGATVADGRNRYAESARDFGARGYDALDHFDVDTSLLAEELGGASRAEIVARLRRELFASVGTHAMGHALGLLHNFAASRDPLNYSTDFWSARAASSGETRYGNASVMEYRVDFRDEPNFGAGAYDAAAIRFLYGQLLETWDPEKVSLPDARKYGSFARRCSYFPEWMTGPWLLSRVDPELIPALLSIPAVDQAPCAGNYEADSSCDTELDAVLRELVVRMEANAMRYNSPTECMLLLNDLEWLDDAVAQLLSGIPFPEPERVHGTRRLVSVEDVIRQEVDVLMNLPEYDDPATPIDESRDDLDNDRCLKDQVPGENGACPDGVADDDGFDWSRRIYEVAYAYCSDADSHGRPSRCDRWDAGWNSSEAVQYNIDRYNRDYMFEHFRRQRETNVRWGDPEVYLTRLAARRFASMRHSSEPDAAYRGLNFLEQVLQSPEPGRHCLDADRNVYERVDACTTQELAVGLGSGRGGYLRSGKSSDALGGLARIGTFYDKLLALHQLTSTFGSPRRSLLATHTNPILQRFASVIESDHTGYRSRLVDVPSGERLVRYMPFFDEAGSGGSVRQELEPLPSIEPSWSSGLSAYALLFGLANWSTRFDGATPFYEFTRITTVRGAPDDVEYPGRTVVELTDPDGGVTYRAPIVEPVASGGLIQPFPTYYGDNFHRSRGMFRNWGIGANLLEDANEYLTATYEPARLDCDEGRGTPESCQRFANAQIALQEKMAIIELVRLSSRRAEVGF